MNPKWFLTLVLVSIFSLVLSACGPAAQATPTPPSSTVRPPNTVTPTPTYPCDGTWRGQTYRLKVGESTTLSSPDGTTNTIICLSDQGTINERVQSLATSAPTPVPTATPIPAIPVVYIHPMCRCRQQVSVGTPVSLRWGWAATTPELTKEFIDASNITMTIDGSGVPGMLEAYWGPIGFQKDAAGSGLDGYRAYWTYYLGDNPKLREPGVHRLELKVELSRKVTDGYDLNKDGKPDEYGPGVTLRGWVEIQVQ